jgi:hypothetical protein
MRLDDVLRKHTRDKIKELHGAESFLKNQEPIR